MIVNLYLVSVLQTSWTVTCNSLDGLLWHERI